MRPAKPVLVDQNSQKIRPFSLQDKPLKLTSFYKSTPSPIEMTFGSVGVWNDFDNFLKGSNIRTKEQPEATESLQQFIIRKITQILINEGIEAKFQNLGMEPGIGSNNLALFLPNYKSRPILVGHHYSVEDLNALDDNATLHRAMIQPASDLSANESKYLDAFRTLCNALLVRDLSTGYIATCNTARFFKIVYADEQDAPPHQIIETETDWLTASIDEDPDSTLAGTLNLLVSRPVSIDEFPSIFVAFCGALAYQNPFLEYKFGLKVTPELSPDPVTYNEGSTRVTPGRLRWWNANRRRSVQYKIFFSSVLSESSLSSVPGVRIGTLVISDQCRLQHMATVIRMASVHDSKDIQNEASVYELLDFKNVEGVPRRLFFGNLFGTYVILVLEPYGRPMTKEDLTPNTLMKMRTSLRNLHDIGIRHGNVVLSSFYIDRQQNVCIADFSNSRLYSKLPDTEKMNERRDLERLATLQVQHH